MATPDTEIQSAFLKGFQEAYAAMFQYLYIRLLDTTSTIVNVYGETSSKVYKKPIKILGHLRTVREEEQDPNKETKEVTNIRIPVQELIDNNIPFSTEADYEVLRQAIFRYGNFTYQVDELTPRSLIAGQYVLFSFTCSPVLNYKKDEYDT